MNTSEITSVLHDETVNNSVDDQVEPISEQCNDNACNSENNSVKTCANLSYSIVIPKSFGEVEANDIVDINLKNDVLVNETVLENSFDDGISELLNESGPPAWLLWEMVATLCLQWFTYRI